MSTSPTNSRSRDFRLVRYFSITAFVLMSLATIGLVAGYRSLVETELVEQASRANVTLARSIYNATPIEVESVRTPLAGAELAAVDDVIRRMVRGTSVHKVKFYDPRGLTLYSTEPAQIGQDKSGTPAIRAAGAGKIVSTLSQPARFNAVEGEVFSRHLLSSYVPVRGADGSVTLIFEIYNELPFSEVASARTHQVYAAIGLLMVLLYGALLVVVHRGSLVIRRQQQSLHQAQDELVAARDAAEQASRAKSAFLANVSHEVRTPLHGVLGLTRLLLDGPLTPQQRNYGDSIQNSGRALLRIINDVLDLSKIESEKLELDEHDFDLRELFGDIRSLMEPPAQQKNLELVIEMPAGEDLWVRGDALRLQQVLLNLVGNAIKFTERGRVVVALRRGARARSFRFSVSDTGIGIERAALDAIFEPFVQADSSTSRRYGGTGLGLAIARNLVRLLGGRIEVSSEPGFGTTFSFSCDLAAASAAPPPRAPERAVVPAAPAPMPLRVLMAEDNPVNQICATALLEQLGCKVTLADNGLSAVELWRSQYFDIVLMDCHMPTMDGFEATAAIREFERKHSLSRTPIIAVTASAFDSERSQCLQVGMDAVLCKPFAQDELASMLARHVPLAPLGLQGAGAPLAA